MVRAMLCIHLHGGVAGGVVDQCDCNRKPCFDCGRLHLSHFGSLYHKDLAHLCCMKWVHLLRLMWVVHGACLNVYYYLGRCCCCCFHKTFPKSCCNKDYLLFLKAEHRILAAESFDVAGFQDHGRIGWLPGVAVHVVPHAVVCGMARVTVGWVAHCAVCCVADGCAAQVENVEIGSMAHVEIGWVVYATVGCVADDFVAHVENVEIGWVVRAEVG